MIFSFDDDNDERHDFYFASYLTPPSYYTLICLIMCDTKKMSTLK